jgi:hypothetical protein
MRIARIKENGDLASKKFNYPKLLNAETKDAFLIKLKKQIPSTKGKSSNTMWEEVKKYLLGHPKKF